MKAIQFYVGNNTYCLCEDGNIYNFKTRHQLKWQSTGEGAPPRKVWLSYGNGERMTFTKEKAAELWREYYKEELYNENQ